MSLFFLNIFTFIPENISQAVETNAFLAYLIIAFSMFLENIIPPIPSEIIMPLGGFFVYQDKLNFYSLIFSGLLGTVLGTLPWYYLGKLLNETRLAKLIDKRGKFLGISSSDLSRSRKWFDRYGVSLVFWGRLIPGIRTLISVPAGMELMPLGKFLVWTIFGSLIWVSFLTFAGYFLGENYQVISLYIDQFKFVLKPIFILLLIFLIMKAMKRIFANK